MLFLPFILFNQAVLAITVGAERFELYLPHLEGKKVGLVVNQSAQVKGEHLLDSLLANNVNIVTVFSPEHGFRGDKGAGEAIDSGIDAATGLPIVSLYGKHKKPTASQLKGLDVLVFDIQDVGVRFYTYISTLHYVLEAAFDLGIAVIVLDRPNPNGKYVDGPVLQPKFRSFVGMHPIPVLHGMTVAELAQMMVGEKWLTLSPNAKANLIVVPVADYRRDMPYSLPIKPSPNLPNDTAIGLYPTLCFFEPTRMSIGRGTQWPFQIVAHPSLKSQWQVTPKSMPKSAPNPKWQDTTIPAILLSKHDFNGIDLGFLLHQFKTFSGDADFITSPSFFDKLAGTDALRKQLIAGESEQAIRKSWQGGIDAFKLARKPYLLYPDYAVSD